MSPVARNRGLVFFALTLLFCRFTFAQKAETSTDSVAPAVFDQTVSKGVGFLLGAQGTDGSFSKQTGPAVTAIAVAALLEHGRTTQDPVIAKGLEFVLGFQQPDGGIYQRESLYQNYETCISIMCLASANENGKYTEVLDKAKSFVKKIQWDEGEGHDPSSLSYGGAGYGNHRRPDLSNTSFMVDALHAAGDGSDDPAIQRALQFVSRCQNLESEFNTTSFPAKVNDGGFYYTVAAGGTSQAGNSESGGLRSYASMTYAGLKSMIYAGVGPEDKRVQAAYQWLQKNYSLTQNPGMGDAGLYYYYHTFAKALAAVGRDEFRTIDGASHNWRQELVDHLAATQLPNGSWVNKNPRWMEGDANLTTSYVLLALAQCRQP